VTESEWVTLADVVEIGDLVGGLHLAQQLVLAVAARGRTRARSSVEVIFDGALAADP